MVVPLHPQNKAKHKVLFHGWSGSSVWLECLPVTQEVASSSLVRTAEAQAPKACAFFVFVAVVFFLFLHILFEIEKNDVYRGNQQAQDFCHRESP